MDNIINRLKELSSKLADESFLSNKGLSNEVGIYVFAYDPKDEIIVREFFSELESGNSSAFRLIECDLYKIFLEICDENRITDMIPKMEEQKGDAFLLGQLSNVASPEAFVNKMRYEPHKFGDILLLTGIGKVYPFMRSHKLLDNIQHVFPDIPILMLYPGEYNGQELSLFGKFLDEHYYRAFNMM